MDTVLGVSMAPTAVRAVLLEGETAEGATIDEDTFDTAAAGEAPPVPAAEQVVSAILGTREGAAEAGYRLRSTGVACTDDTQAAALRDALAAHKVENVMLVSAFWAAAALAQTVATATGYDHTALLYIEPDTATLAMVDTADGSIADVHHAQLPDDDDQAVATLTDMISGAETLPEHPDGVIVVGSGVDIPMIKPALQAATSLPVNVPDEPETALARGAALASANAPLFASSTAALAYAKDPGTGEVDPSAVSTSVAVAVPVAPGGQALAYSAEPDEQADPDPAAAHQDGLLPHAFRRPRADRGERGRTPFVLPGSVLAAVVVAAMVAVVTVVAIGIRPTVHQPPTPAQNVVIPTKQAPAPAMPAPAPVAPAPVAPAPQAPAPAPEAQVPAPAPAVPAPAAQVPAPAPVPAPLPVAPLPAPARPAAPVPAPVPVAPAPAPVAPVPAPPPLPAPLIIVPLPPIFRPPVPPIFGPPGPGHGGKGHGGNPHRGED